MAVLTADRGRTVLASTRSGSTAPAVAGSSLFAKLHDPGIRKVGSGAVGARLRQLDALYAAERSATSHPRSLDEIRAVLCSGDPRYRDHHRPLVPGTRLLMGLELRNRLEGLGITLPVALGAGIPDDQRSRDRPANEWTS